MPTTWNPSDKSAGVTLSGGDLIASGAGIVRATNSVSGLNYFEVKAGSVNAFEPIVGLVTSAYPGGGSGGAGFAVLWNGTDFGVTDVATGSLAATFAGTIANNDVIGFAVNTTTLRLYISYNGTFVVGNPVAGTGGLTLSSGTYFPLGEVGLVGGSSTATLQADTTTYSPPTGYSLIGGGGPVGYTLTADAGTYAITGQAVPLPAGVVPLNSFQGAAGGTTTATIPTHAAGDLLIAWAFRDGSTTQPTLPGGWTSITTRAGTTCCGRLAYKFAAGSSETSGTWTNATDLAIAVYRGVDRVGASNVNSGTGNINYPALTLQSGSAWVLGAAGHRSVNTALETPPSGMTNRHTQVDATDESALHDTNGVVSSWASTNVTLGGTSSGWVSIVAELIPKYSGVPAAGYDLAANVGSYAVSGVSAGLRVARRLAANTGSYSLTGQAAGLKRGLRVAAGQGIYSLTGVSAGLLASRRVAADPGNYALTGIDATLVYTPATAAYTLTADAGSYSLTGNAAALRAARKVAAAQGTYALTGVTTGLRVTRRLVADGGVYTLSGFAAQVIVARRLTAAPGSYVVTGQTVSFNGQKTLTAEAGVYVLSGQDAGLTYQAGQPTAPVEIYGGGGSSDPFRRDELRAEDRKRLRAIIERAMADPSEEAETLQAVVAPVVTVQGPRLAIDWTGLLSRLDAIERAAEAYTIALLDAERQMAEARAFADDEDDIIAMLLAA